jgi:hypothetical protein
MSDGRVTVRRWPGESDNDFLARAYAVGDGGPGGQAARLAMALERQQQAERWRMAFVAAGAAAIMLFREYTR